MSTSVLICDDSKLARRQLARSLPDDWDIKVEFAYDGVDCIKQLTKSPPEILFLDLNMPEMDGYGVLAAMKEQGLDVLTVVVSGDIQPSAHQRVLELGAIDFIQKPCSPEKLAAIIEHHGIRDRALRERMSHSLGEQVDPDVRDIYQELTNVAMGQAGDLLARLLNVFVKLPIPNVNLIEVSELHMMLSDIESHEEVTAVCQGFLGPGVSGEALCILSDSSFDDVAKILNVEGEVDDQLQLAAVEAQRVGGRYTQLSRVAVTSCQVCGRNETPLWQIRADRVIHDQDARQLYFEGAQLRVLDVPILWVPQLRLPDPTLERARGFLTPTLRSTSLLGTGLRLPYFIPIGDHQDLTLTPYLSSETRTLEARYRRAFTYGNIELNGAITKDSLLPGDTRGYFFAAGEFALRNGFRFDFDIETVSDDSYFNDYDYGDNERLQLCANILYTG